MQLAAEKEVNVVLLTTKTKKQETKPSAFPIGMHKEFRKMDNVVQNQVTSSYYMTDLPKPTLPRLSIYCNLQLTATHGWGIHPLDPVSTMS